MKSNEHVTMGEDDSGFVGRRQVLGDVTNTLGKRRVLSTSGGSVLENENGFGKIGDGKLEDDAFRRRACKGVDDLVKEKENVALGSLSSGNLPVGDGKTAPSFNAKRLCRSVNSGDDGGDESSQENFDVSEGPLEIRELPLSLNCDLHSLRGEAVTRETVEGDGSGDSSISSACLPMRCDSVGNSSPITGVFHDDNGKHSGDAARDDVNEAPGMSDHEKSDKGKCLAGDWQPSAPNACNPQFVGSQESKTDCGERSNQAPLDKSGSTACLLESNSLGSKFFDLEGSAKAHESCGDGGFNPNGCFESEKTCSCPFCLKAAYLWSDLNYEDARERQAALRKSRKQVRQLLASYNHNEVGKTAHDGSDKSAKIELDLMHQWRSLFLHTEDVLVRESNRLQSDIFKLKELKENCKRDLEILKGAP